jgi:NOL1/NOP2/fmu family ribosome biogenesis protein
VSDLIAAFETAERELRRGIRSEILALPELRALGEKVQAARSDIAVALAERDSLRTRVDAVLALGWPVVSDSVDAILRGEP